MKGIKIVFQGLNACLDHRATVFIPELDRTFDCHPEFRVFAAQNPYSEGGGRKGLPKSFLNRFTQVCIILASCHFTASNHVKCSVGICREFK
jgi:midasin (ATPase involved in ribosome maturation)